MSYQGTVMERKGLPLTSLKHLQWECKLIVGSSELLINSPQILKNKTDKMFLSLQSFLCYPLVSLWFLYHSGCISCPKQKTSGKSTKKAFCKWYIHFLRNNFFLLVAWVNFIPCRTELPEYLAPDFISEYPRCGGWDSC